MSRVAPPIRSASESSAYSALRILGGGCCWAVVDCVSAVGLVTTRYRCQATPSNGDCRWCHRLLRGGWWLRCLP